MTRWELRIASHACFLVCTAASAAASADDVVFIVNGTVQAGADCRSTPASAKAASSGPARTCSLYWGAKAQSGSRLASARINGTGRFKLIPDGVSKTLRQRHLIVACPSLDHIHCTTHPLSKDEDYSVTRDNLTVADVELTCHSMGVGASPAELGAALAAFAETRQVLVWAGVEKLEAADAALKTAVAQADAPLTAPQREQLRAALAAAGEPLRTRPDNGVPLLPSLRPVNFADELIAAAPARRWLIRPEKNDQVPTGYDERDVRFEGNVVHRVGATFSNALVSLSEGALSVAPQTQRTVTLTWRTSAPPRVCLEAKPSVPDIGWTMRAAAAAGQRSFTWDLEVARQAQVKDGVLGIVARSCADADHGQRRYIPVRAGPMSADEMAYRLVFLFPRQLTTINVAVFQGDDAAPRTIELPAGSIRFDPDAQRPVITIDIPTLKLVPGLVFVEMRGRGAGRFGPERLSFLHSP